MLLFKRQLRRAKKTCRAQELTGLSEGKQGPCFILPEEAPSRQSFKVFPLKLAKFIFAYTLGRFSWGILTGKDLGPLGRHEGIGHATSFGFQQFPALVVPPFYSETKSSFCSGHFQVSSSQNFTGLTPQRKTRWHQAFLRGKGASNMTFLPGTHPVNL